MRESKQEGGVKSKSRQLQESGEMQLERVEEGGMFSSQRDPLVGGSGMDNVPSVRSHAAMLNRSPATGQSSNRQLVLQLQQQYGNRYVNQVVQTARQEEALQSTTSLEQDEFKKGEVGVIGEGIAASGVHQENKTGLPDNLKAGIENLSGMAMDHVRVHYNSSKPAQLQALAYTQGTDIHIAPDQEEHLPHEAWHVVQQMQGRVKPTMQMKGVEINNDEGLESEADVMGEKVDQVIEKKLQLGKPQKLQITISKQIGNVVQGFTLGDRPFAEAYSSLTNSDTWFSEAKEYEQCLGSYAYHHPLSNDALDAGINKMETVLTDYYKAEHTKEEIYKSFFKDDPGSAGQVGLDLDIDRMTQVLHNGNLRERMTAFYNAAYYAGGTGNNLNIGFKALLHDLVFKKKAGLAPALNLDADTLKQQISYYTSYLSKKGWTGYSANLILRSLFQANQSGKDLVNKVAEYFGYEDFNAEGLMQEDKSYLFDKDVFALGNLSLQSSISDLGEIYESQKDRFERSPGKQEDLKNTPEHYAQLGVPLSDEELAYIFQDVSKPWWKFWQSQAAYRREKTATEKLSWLEGHTYYDISPDNSWYKRIHDRLRMPVVAGVSGTTTRMLTAFKLLNTGEDWLNFRLAIMGWMLTSWDHSLYEILRGSHIAGLKPDGEVDRMNDVIRMYQTVEPLQTPELRSNVAKNKMFPHELIFLGTAQGNDFMSVSQDIVDASNQKLTQAELNDPNQYRNLSKAQALTITNYTSGIHSLVNAVMEGIAYYSVGGLNERVIKMIIRSKLDAVITKKEAGQPVEWINVLNPKQAEINHLADPTVSAEDKQNIRAELSRWLDQVVERLYPELMLQANMTVEGLSSLPSVNGITVYRGDWESTLKYPSFYSEGKELSSYTFASYTKNKATAIGFIKEYFHQFGKRPVLIELTMTGRGGKDISELSIYPGEQEVLLAPGSKIRLGRSSTEIISGTAVKIVPATEI